MLPTRFLLTPSLLLLCSFSLATPPSSYSFVDPEPSVDFIAIATAFSPAPALLSHQVGTASISSLESPSSSTSATDSAQSLAQHESELLVTRLEELDRMIETPKFLNATELSSSVRVECKVFIKEFKQLVQIGAHGYKQLMKHQEAIAAVTQKASAMVISFASMNFPGVAIAISQLLPDVAKLVSAVAPELLELIKAAAPVAARLLKSAFKIPEKIIKKVKHNVRNLVCRVNRSSSKKMSKRRLRYCIRKGYLPKDYVPDRQQPSLEVNTAPDHKNDNDDDKKRTFKQRDNDHNDDDDNDGGKTRKGGKLERESKDKVRGGSEGNTDHSTPVDQGNDDTLVKVLKIKKGGDRRVNRPTKQPAEPIDNAPVVRQGEAPLVKKARKGGGDLAGQIEKGPVEQESSPAKLKETVDRKAPIPEQRPEEQPKEEQLKNITTISNQVEREGDSRDEAMQSDKVAMEQ